MLTPVAPFATGAMILPTDPSVQVSGLISQPGLSDFYQVTLDTQGLFVAKVQASGANTLLSLKDDQGKTMIQGETSSPSDPDARIAQHLPAGTYFLSVSAVASSGKFDLSTAFTPSLDPGSAISEGQGAYGVTTADINGDGKADIIVPDYYYNQILINDGVGDGTFQPPVAVPVGIGPRDVLAVDLFGNGHLDLVVVDQLSNDIMILKSDGQGGFQAAQTLPTLDGPVKVTAGDFFGDGKLDLAVAESTANTVQIFRNQGNGQFIEANRFHSIEGPTSITSTDFNRDGRPDLVVSSGDSGSLILLDGLGHDNFVTEPVELIVGSGCSDVIAANLDGGSRPELAAVSSVTGTVSIFRFDGFAYRLASRLQAGTGAQALIAADFNGDGRLDLAVADYGSNDVSVFVNKGDADFGPAMISPTGSGPIDLASADFNGNGRADLVTTDLIDLTVSVLVNNGDATFQSPASKPISVGPEDVVTADLNGDGIPDLVVPDIGLNRVSVLLGRGDGTFHDPIQVPAGSGPNAVAIGDFNGDHIPDMAVADYFSNTLMILQGVGDGTFRTIETLPTGEGPSFIKAADLDQDGHLDLVVANYLSNDLSIFYGRGDGTFANAVEIPVGLGPSGISIADLDKDGRPDIAVSDSASNDVEILIATGARSYAPPSSFAAGEQPWDVTAADFNGDGHLDLIVSDGLSTPSSVSVLFGFGDGTFGPPTSFGVDGSPFPLAVGDFNNDGHLDVVTGNDITNDLSVLIGRGDGTFAQEVRLPGGIDPYGVALADLNHDGHLDIVVANYQSSDLTVYLGRGDGTFESPETIPLVSPDLPTITADLENNGSPQVIVANPEAGTIAVFNSEGDGTLQRLSTIDIGGSPSGLAVGDFNGDGRPDLAVTDADAGTVVILLGLGDGTFQSPTRYRVGESPRSPVVGDFNLDGNIDIAVANTNSNDVSILLGNGDGTFLPERRFAVGQEPTQLLIGASFVPGILNLATVNRTSHDLTELAGLSGLNFVKFTLKSPGFIPSSLVSGDFIGDGQTDFAVSDAVAGLVYVHVGHINPAKLDFVPIEVGRGEIYMATADLYGDGKSELILANALTNVVTILSDWANQTFEKQTTFPVDVAIAGLSVIDLNHDGLPDILITQARTGAIEDFINGGRGVFSSPGSTVPLPNPTPIIFPISSSGVSDIIDLTNNGEILNRLGLVGAVAEFGAPINETAATGIAVRDFAYVQTGGIPDVASLDTQKPLIYVQNTVETGPDGVTLLHLPDVGNYTRIISSDLFGTGLDDLVVINRSMDEIVIYQQISSGVFAQNGDLISVGFGPTDVIAANLNPGGLPDLVVSDGSSGEITVIARDSRGGFFNSSTLSAGLAAAGTISLPTGIMRVSPDQPVGLASGVFGPSGLADVVVVDHGTDQITVLQGLPGGGLAAPEFATTYSTGQAPIQVVAASLGRNGLLDLVVLNEGSHDISIYLNDGHGGFIAQARVDAGDNPTALAVLDVTGDGVSDLVVSNSSGDILILSGNGDGTFQPYQRADGTVSLAVGDLTGDGQTDFVLSNTAQDLLTVQTSSSTPGFLQGRGDGLLAPGPVAIADMNGDGIPDLVVTNTGGNDVFVYLGLGQGRFAEPQRFFTGTAPIGLTVADLTGHGLPDLIVANSDSNDVTILLGKIEADGSWTMVPGPRLKAGERPISTTVADLNGDGILDIVVVNQDSDTVTLLQGLGGGFFDDSDPSTFATGLGPVQAFVGHFSLSKAPGLIILNSLSNDMTYYANINTPAVIISTGGIDPVSGVMGDFNHDGFTDLAIANNGDSRITVFYGGISGPTLARTIILGGSTHPTDLVVTATDSGGIQFFVGAVGQNHAIQIDFTALVILVVAEPIPTSGGLVNSASTIRVSAGGLSTTSEFTPSFFEETGNVASVQAQESSTSSAQTGDVSAAVSQAIAVVTTLTQAAQSLYLPSPRTLGWLIDNLVQLAEGQTAEILPLGRNEIAAIAVLLSGQGLTASLRDMAIPPIPITSEDDTPFVAAYIPQAVATLPPSRLTRFVADLGHVSIDLTSEVVARTHRALEFGPEWVWTRRPDDLTTTTATFDASQEGGLSRRSADRVPDASIAIDLDPVADSNNRAGAVAEAEAEAGEEPSTWKRVAVILSAAVTLAIGVVVAGRFDWRTLRKLRRDRAKVDGHQSTRERINGQVGVNTLAWKDRPALDLPPWLLSPTEVRIGKNQVDWSFAATFLRRRGREE